MRIALVPVMALALIAAAEPDVTDTDNLVAAKSSRLQDGLRSTAPVQRLPMIDPDSLNCSDELITAGADDIQLQPERETADPENPLLYYAMDLRVENCSMMVLKNGRRQLPPAPRAEAQLDPAQ